MQLKLNKILGNNNEKYAKYLELIPDFKKEKTQKFTTIVLTLIAIIILAIFAINPTLSTIANLQKQLDDAKFVTTKLQEKINDLSILQTKYNSIAPDLPVIYDAIPKNSQVPMLTGQIQALAKTSNIALVDFQANEITKTPQNFSFYSFSLSANGNYNDILNFLDQLVSMQRVTDIESINIANGTAPNSPLQISLKGEAFFKD